MKSGNHIIMNSIGYHRLVCEVQVTCTANIPLLCRSVVKSWTVMRMTYAFRKWGTTMTDYSEDTTYERGEKWRAPLFCGSVEKPITAI